MSVATASMKVTAESLGVTREGSQTPGSGDNCKTHVHLPLWNRHGGREGVDAESHRAQEGWRGESSGQSVATAMCAMSFDSATWLKLQSEEGPSVSTEAARSPQRLALTAYFLRNLS